MNPKYPWGYMRQRAAVGPHLPLDLCHQQVRDRGLLIGRPENLATVNKGEYGEGLLVWKVSEIPRTSEMYFFADGGIQPAPAVGQHVRRRRDRQIWRSKYPHFDTFQNLSFMDAHTKSIEKAGVGIAHRPRLYFWGHWSPACARLRALTG